MNTFKNKALSPEEAAYFSDSRNTGTSESVNPLLASLPIDWFQQKYELGKKRFRVGSAKGESPHRTADKFLELSHLSTSISTAWGDMFQKKRGGNVITILYVGIRNALESLKLSKLFSSYTFTTFFFVHSKSYFSSMNSFIIAPFTSTAASTRASSIFKVKFYLFF